MNEEGYWQAIQARDTSADGMFIYAVRSTGIYCRPTCPSRRPNREQVVFFQLPAAAERAGFRPCRRCHPDEAALREPQVELIQRACHYIAERLDSAPTLEDIGREVGLSPHHLQRTFKRIMGITPRQYADACRLGQFKARLKEGDDVTTALYEAGYGSSSRLYEQAPARLGMTPATYRRGGLGAQIEYTIADSPLGRLLVAATERGVCFVSLGDADADLEAALRSEYPAATIEANSNAGDSDVESGLHGWVKAILQHLEGQLPHLDLPVDVQATAFQWRVWEALRAIPYGDTRSYRAVAEALGQPTAARAVARACATNPVALVIPCHRVVGEDGGLRGYRWGAERKRALLEQEANGEA
ncbi:MAG TPA: bifunctional DNA-binding transcriptional regulator/O6-methylguanine-DNA methyltransferase Ada [Roseiflexaceae bacterium]|nr:bifunctional DNA-binding transcriptional regulator/O6-methylguanine-DNA methyltransferase Ada [Roseiflexaceae bacterium]